ncbi:hypothetical protein [Streptomyces sp. NBC_00151]|uniref:hypothetical protein n=1 Tax=Streptomyces sp. NBC_00151 TaxID=2975669 RepID=UPI002DDAE9EB|nr:hypothetical protein [Streptomyces sp. NBC_00151]WRZ41734.1 hypothetical protein OG915_29075 [Streptomyces sp. NBC_00151]
MALTMTHKVALTAAGIAAAATLAVGIPQAFKHDNPQCSSNPSQTRGPGDGDQNQTVVTRCE